MGIDIIISIILIWTIIVVLMEMEVVHHNHNIQILARPAAACAIFLRGKGGAETAHSYTWKRKRGRRSPPAQNFTLRKTEIQT